MPRKPTRKVLAARESLIQLLTAQDGMAPLPPVRELAVRLGVNPATVFRLLRDLTHEGIAWQSPSGRFHVNAAKNKNLRGAPLCFVGREMTHWNRLYQEILEGISEVCAANQSPLVLLSSPPLVRQTGPDSPPAFAGKIKQTRELEALLQQSPKGTAGWILDHLWLDEVLRKHPWTAGAKVQVVHGNPQTIPLSRADPDRSSELALRHLRSHSCPSVIVLRPFRGDPAIDAATDLLIHRLKDLEPQEIDPHQLPALLKKSSGPRFEPACILCTEDNTLLTAAVKLREKGIPPERIRLFAAQGTGLITSPHARLRIDYRKIGRKAASAILHGTAISPEKATLLD